MIGITCACIATLAVAGPWLGPVAAVQDPLVYEIRIVRQWESADQDGIFGTITVQGEMLGQTIERRSKALKAGSYSGKMRYDSGKGFAVGPLPGNLGSITMKGDFLIKISGAVQRDGTPMTAVLIHNGSRPENSEGCILVGGPAKNSILSANHPLITMRALFFKGIPEGNPLLADVKGIHIVVSDPPTKRLAK